MKRRNVKVSQENEAPPHDAEKEKASKQPSQFQTMTRVVNIYVTLIWFLTGGTLVYSLYSDTLRKLISKFELFAHSSFFVIVIIVFLHVSLGSFLKKIRLTMVLLILYSIAHVILMTKTFYSLNVSGSAVAFLYLVCQLFTISSFLTFYSTFNSTKEPNTWTGILIVTVAIGFFYFTTNQDEGFKVDLTKIATSSTISFLYGLYMIFQTKQIYNGTTLISSMVQKNQLAPNDYTFAILSVFVDFIFGYAAPFFCLYALIRRNTPWDPLEFLWKTDIS